MSGNAGNWRVRKEWATQSDGRLLLPVDDAGQPVKVAWGIHGEATPGLELNGQPLYFDRKLGVVVSAGLRDILADCLRAAGEL